jgi:hypothetical protein
MEKRSEHNGFHGDRLAHQAPDSSVGVAGAHTKLKSKLDLKTTLWKLRLRRIAALV